MPYVSENARRELDGGRMPDTAGELNYKLTRTVLAYLEAHGAYYQTFNEALGALEGCKLELYRRRVAPYEEEKILVNGDVY